MAVRFFLKSVGLSSNPLPARWWEERSELVRTIYFNRPPKAISPGDTLIYYAVGGDGRLCGVVEVVGEASSDFQPPENWTPELRQKLKWCMPVAVQCRCSADDKAPRLADFHDKRIGQGSFQSIDDAVAVRIIAAIRARAAQEAV